jgi:threonine dehydratase
MGFAALPKLRKQLAGRRVGIIFCGGNIDTGTLRRHPVEGDVET